MSDFNKNDAVQILTNLDAMTCGHIPGPRLAWAHMFVACGIIQREIPGTMKLTRERFMELAGKVHDRIYSALESKGVEA